MATLTQVGRSVPRLEGQAKVTGRAEYVHNLRLPGMLYGKIVRGTKMDEAHGMARHQVEVGRQGRLGRGLAVAGNGSTFQPACQNDPDQQD